MCGFANTDPHRAFVASAASHGALEALALWRTVLTKVRLINVVTFGRYSSVASYSLPSVLWMTMVLRFVGPTSSNIILPVATSSLSELGR